MKTLFILSPLSQFEVTSLIGLNAPILGHVNLTLTNLGLYSLFKREIQNKQLDINSELCAKLVLKIKQYLKSPFFRMYNLNLNLLKIIMRLIKWVLNCKPIVNLKQKIYKKWENLSNFYNMHSFLFLFILEKLNINENLFSDSVLSPGSSSGDLDLYQFSFWIFMLSLVSLLSLIKMLGYFISISLIHKYDIKNRYPKYIKLISYFENSSLIFVIIEILFCLISLGLVVVFSFVVYTTSDPPYKFIQM